MGSDIITKVVIDEVDGERARLFWKRPTDRVWRYVDTYAARDHATQAEALLRGALGGTA